MVSIILSGCANSSTQEEVEKNNNGKEPEQVDDNALDNKENNSNEVEQTQEDTEPDPTLIHVGTYERMGDKPIPFKDFSISQTSKDVYVYDLEDSQSYAVIVDKQTFSDPIQNKALGQLVENKSIKTEEGELTLLSLSASGIEKEEAFDIPNHDDKNIKTENTYSSDGISRLYMKDEGKEGIEIVSLLSPADKITVPGKGYEISKFNGFYNTYKMKYVDLVNKRIVSYWQETKSGNTTAFIQLFDLDTGEPVWDVEGKRLTVSLKDLYDPVFHVDENGTLTAAGMGQYSKDTLSVIQLDKDLNQVFYDKTSLDIKEADEIQFSKDGTINIYYSPLYKEKEYLSLVQMKIGLP